MKLHIIDSNLYSLAKERKLKEFTKKLKYYNIEDVYSSVVIKNSKGSNPRIIELKCLGVEKDEKAFTVKVGKIIHYPITLHEKQALEIEKHTKTLIPFFSRMYKNNGTGLTIQEVAERTNISYQLVVRLWADFNMEKTRDANIQRLSKTERLIAIVKDELNNWKDGLPNEEYEIFIENLIRRV